MSNEAVPMTPSEAVQQRLRELKIVLDPEIDYRLEQVFPKLKGWGANRTIKRRAKLIRLVEPTLYHMLLAGEEVLYVAKGVQYSLAENYFMGALWSTLLNQTVFVLTNARLLMMRSNNWGKPSEMFWVVYYSEIANFKASWTGVLKLNLQDKKQLKFTGFPAQDRKTMPAIFQQALDDYRRLNFAPFASQSRENLCCRCFKVVSKGDFVCSHCGTQYWTPRGLALRSLVFPSWGDFCMKHYFLASAELACYLLSWTVAITRFADNDSEGAVAIVVMILLFENSFDAILTYLIARKGLNHRRDRHPDQPQPDAGEKNHFADADGATTY